MPKKQRADPTLNRYLPAGPSLALLMKPVAQDFELIGQVKGTRGESPVGFRHGPKSLINEDTVVLVFGTTMTVALQVRLGLGS